MRNLFLILLLSTAAVPALANRPDDGDDRRSRHAAASNDDGDNRRAARSNRSSEASQSPGESRRSGFIERRSEPRQASAQATAPGDARPARGEWRRSHDDTPRVRSPEVLEARPAETTATNIHRDRRSGDGSFRQRRGEQSAQHDGRRRWSGDWRRDNRYDWRRHRDRHRSVFRIGFYSDPFGWNYRRWSVGWRLRPAYYQSNYWLNDPWMYRLPPAYGPYRWVRYFDDALLVNTYTGEVVDVIHSFFW